MDLQSVGASYGMKIEFPWWSTISPRGYNLSHRNQNICKNRICFQWIPNDRPYLQIVLDVWKNKTNQIKPAIIQGLIYGPINISGASEQFISWNFGDGVCWWPEELRSYGCNSGDICIQFRRIDRTQFQESDVPDQVSLMSLFWPMDKESAETNELLCDQAQMQLHFIRGIQLNIHEMRAHTNIPNEVWTI